MKKLLTSILLCCVLVLQAQSNAIQNALKVHDYEQAIKLISKEKKSPEMDLLKATCFKNIARYDDAIALLEEIVKNEHENNIASINELADCYQQEGNFRKAKLYYYMALQQTPDSRYAQLNYLNITYKLKELNQTIKLAHSIFQKDTVPVLLPVLGDCFTQLGKTDSAIYYYRKAMSHNPADFNSLSKLSKLYIQTEKFDDLVSSTDRFILSDSSNQIINQYNGIGLCMSKKHDKAIYRLKTLSQQGDSSFLTNYYLGASYYAIADYIDAYNHLSRAYRNDSSNIRLHYYLGESAIMSGHQPRGIQVLTEGLNLLIPKDSELFNYYYCISKGYNGMSKPLDEIKYLKLSYDHKQDYKLIYNIAAIYDYQIQNPEEALNYYTRLMATQPKTKTTPAITNGTLNLSYYGAVENRIKELKEIIETKKNKH